MLSACECKLPSLSRRNLGCPLLSTSIDGRQVADACALLIRHQGPSYELRTVTSYRLVSDNDQRHFSHKSQLCQTHTEGHSFSRPTNRFLVAPRPPPDHYIPRSSTFCFGGN